MKRTNRVSALRKGWAVATGMLLTATIACGPLPPANEPATIQDLADRAVAIFTTPLDREGSELHVVITLPFLDAPSADGPCPQLGEETTARYLRLPFEVSHGGGFSRSVAVGGFGAPYKTGCLDAAVLGERITDTTFEARGNASVFLEDDTGSREIVVDEDLYEMAG